MNEIKLSPVERLILRNQFELLNHTPSGSNDELVEILERGYEREYGRVFDALYEPMPADHSEEVINILDMYAALQSSIKHLLDPSIGIGPRQADFPGFDANDELEVRYLGYAKFLRKREQFSHVVIAVLDLNSHFPRLRQYRAMLPKWLALPLGIERGQRHQMKKEQVEAILRHA